MIFFCHLSSLLLNLMIYPKILHAALIQLNAINFSIIYIILSFQEFHAATTEDLKRRRYADNRTAVLLQIRDRPRPGGANVQVPQVHLRLAAARRRSATGQDTRLW